MQLCVVERLDICPVSQRTLDISCLGKSTQASHKVQVVEACSDFLPHGTRGSSCSTGASFAATKQIAPNPYKSVQIPAS